VITSFADQTTADIFNGQNSKAARHVPQTVWPTARRKLDMLNAAQRLGDLSVPPNNKLEKLQGDLDGFHSIRINDQYRVIFRFANSQASDVQVVDYH
jgi:toxin HigB-1